jgi:hypothetical protein
LEIPQRENSQALASLVLSLGEEWDRVLGHAPPEGADCWSIRVGAHAIVSDPNWNSCFDQIGYTIEGNTVTSVHATLIDPGARSPGPRAILDDILARGEIVKVPAHPKTTFVRVGSVRGASVLAGGDPVDKPRVWTLWFIPETSVRTTKPVGGNAGSPPFRAGEALLEPERLLVCGIPVYLGCGQLDLIRFLHQSGIAPDGMAALNPKIGVGAGPPVSLDILSYELGRSGRVCGVSGIVRTTGTDDQAAHRLFEALLKLGRVVLDSENSSERVREAEVVVPRGEGALPVRIRVHLKAPGGDTRPSRDSPGLSFTAGVDSPEARPGFPETAPWSR